MPLRNDVSVLRWLIVRVGAVRVAVERGMALARCGTLRAEGTARAALSRCGTLRALGVERGNALERARRELSGAGLTVGTRDEVSRAGSALLRGMLLLRVGAVEREGTARDGDSPRGNALLRGTAGALREGTARDGASPRGNELLRAGVRAGAGRCTGAGRAGACLAGAWR